MRFGITIKPDMTVERIVALTRQAEASGFQYGWIFDSHVLWLDPYPLLTLMASNTKNMRLGPCVTNPATRDITVTASLFATLNLISGDRMQLGIGRGDSSRRVLGKKPVGAGDLERAVKTFAISLLGVRSITKVSLRGSPGRRVSSGLDCGIRAEGSDRGPSCRRRILQFADPDLIAWCLGFVKRGRAAGRDSSKIEIMSAAPVWVSDDLKVASGARTLVSGAGFESRGRFVSRYKPEELPPALTSYVRNRGGYDYQHHCEVDSSNANFVSDEVVDRFCLVRPVGLIAKNFASWPAWE